MKKISYLLKYARAQVGRPYWCGTFGQIATEWLYRYNRGRLPMFYQDTDFPSQYGQKVHDCVGLIKGAMWSNTPESAPVYIMSQDVPVKSMYDLAAFKGKITKTTTLTAGVLLFNASFGHVGIYDGQGYVIEAKGHKYGVQKSVYIASLWSYWSKCPYFDYDEEKEPAGELKKGDKVFLEEGAPIYGTKKKFADFVYNVPCYVLEVNKNRVVFSISLNGPVTGAVNKKYLYRKE